MIRLTLRMMPGGAGGTVWIGWPVGSGSTILPAEWNSPEIAVSVWDPLPLLTYVVDTPYGLVTVVDWSASSVVPVRKCSRLSSLRMP